MKNVSIGVAWSARNRYTLCKYVQFEPDTDFSAKITYNYDPNITYTYSTI